MRILKEYLLHAPVSHALQRAIECRKLKEEKEKFIEPILDIGCGDGVFASMLFDEPIFLGLDLTLKELILAKKRRIYKYLTLANAEKLPFSSCAFNTVLSNCAIEHIVNLESVIAEIYRVLKKGGYFIFTVPSEMREIYSPLPWIKEKGINFFPNLINKLLRALWHEHHIYPPSKWRERLKEVGFEVVTSRYFFPKESYAAYGRFLFFSAISFLNKKLFNRWILFSRCRKLFIPYLAKHLEKYYLLEDGEKGTLLLIIAYKN